MRLFVNLQARGQAPDWVMSPEGADVVLQGPGQAGTPPWAEEVITVADAGLRPPPGQAWLSSPLQYDDLQATLQAAASALHMTARTGARRVPPPAGAGFVSTVTDGAPGGAPSGFASTLSEARTLDTDAATNARQRLARLAELEQLQRELAARSRPAAALPAPPAPAVERDTLPPQPAPPPTAEASPATLDPAQPLRLVRWPSHDDLRRDPRHARLAGFLATRPLSCNELARLSGVEQAICHDLALALLAGGCVVAEARAPVAAPPPAATVTVLAASPAMAPRAVVNRGLIARLRQRFGLR